MSMPFYVSPEQMMKDRADYARKGIARGRALVASTFADGILLCAENPSRTLRKISEIYDRIAFAGVGKYNEFDQLRIAGVRHADLKGFAFSREDVDARSLANQYAQMLGQVFTHEMKPMEVEILVAEVGHEVEGDQLFHILYDGTLIDETDWLVLGGAVDVINTRMAELFRPGGTLVQALSAAVEALAGPDRTLGADQVEVAILDRGNSRRAFKQLDPDDLAILWPQVSGQPDTVHQASAAPAEAEAGSPDATTPDATESSGGDDEPPALSSGPPPVV